MQIISLLNTAIALYIYIVIAWVVVGMLVSFNIINPNQSMVRKIVSLLNRACEPALAPIRKILPSAAGIDFSPIILILLLAFAGDLLNTIAYSGDAIVPLLRLISAVLSLLMITLLVLGILNVLIAFRVINTYQPLVQAILMGIRRLCDPMLRYIQPYAPKVRGIDSSPLIAAAGLFVLNRLMFAFF